VSAVADGPRDPRPALGAGNLQHAKLIDAVGLTWWSRLHLAVGIMSYLASPLWLILLCVGFALSLQSHLIRARILHQGLSALSNWPRFDARLLTQLFVFSMFVLLIPKCWDSSERSSKVPSVAPRLGDRPGIQRRIELFLSALYARC